MVLVIERFITEHCEHDCEAAGQEECVREYNTEDYDEECGCWCQDGILISCLHFTELSRVSTVSSEEETRVECQEEMCCVRLLQPVKEF